MSCEFGEDASERKGVEVCSERAQCVFSILRPYRSLPFPPLPPPPSTSVALIVKDPQREYKDLLESKNIKFIERVVGMTKLRGKHAPYEARRRLCSEHDVWLCDERLIPSLPKVLGKTWFDAKK